jgi:peptide/nickel transport system permease protein
MTRWLGRALLRAIPVLIIVPLLVFLLVDLAPGDVATSVAGENASPEQVAQVRQRLHLNDPVLVRFVRWESHAVRGDLGRSLVTNEPVRTIIARALPVTLSLGALSVLMTIIIGVLAGVWAARRPKGVADRTIAVIASVAVAVPSFWLGLILALVVGIHLHWLPALGYVSFATSPVEWLKSLILPSLALSALPAAEMARQTRAALVDELGKDYITAARARGISERGLVLKQALKNAGVPIVTVLGFRIAQLLGGAVIVENVFGLRGVGALTIEAASARDVGILLGVVALATIAIVAINLMVDLSYGYFNPKARQVH